MIAYNEIKYFSWKFIVFLFYVLVFGRGSSLVTNFDPRINPVGTLFYIMCIIYLLRNRNITYIADKAIFYRLLWIGLFVWTFLHLFILDGEFPLVIYSQFCLHILTGILIIKTYANDLGIYYEKAMVLFSMISIPCWAIETFVGYGILEKFPLLLENTLGNGQYSILFYTLGDVKTSLGRNSGCAWEPGLFAVMLCIALLFNIARNKGIRFNKSLIILLFALITTFSTTGYIAALVIFACHYLFSKRITFIRRILYLSIFCTIFICINKLPFMAEKIESRGSVENFVTESDALEWYEKEHLLFTVDRFEGISLDYKNFRSNPIFGYGLQREKSFVYRNISPYIITSNGIVKPFAQMGIILASLFLLLMYKSCFKLNTDYKFDTSWILFVVIIVCSVSYMFDSTPIMRAIQFYALYKAKNVI